ncbi:MAG: RNA polymerase sigma factor [Spirochaetes bacterium]|nr:RNA polymerase sigma factor [Spirochaetota bacterium]
MLSYNEIHDSYYQKILRYLSRIVGQDEAEDISQEVFIKINKSLDTLQDENKLTYWIYRVALNAARDHIRTKKSKVPVVSIEDLAGSMDSGCHSRLKEFADSRAKTPEEKLIKDEMLQCYIDYVEKLPEKYYQIYVLDEFEGFSNQEIADKLSISLDTVKIRLHRARNELNELLRKNCSCYSDKNGNIMCEPCEPKE